MPKDTFNKLKSPKKERIINALLEEFTYHNFDEASITAVVKKLGIAKGSIYQYFDDKKDIFSFLQQHCGALKMEFINNIERKDFPDFWSYLLKMYEDGYDFLEKHPKENAFMYMMQENMNTPSLRYMYDIHKSNAIETMEKWIKPEIKTGSIRTDLSTKTLGFYLYDINSNILDNLKYVEDFDLIQNIKDDLPISGEENKQKFMRVVRNNITILKNAFEIKT